MRALFSFFVLALLSCVGAAPLSDTNKPISKTSNSESSEYSGLVGQSFWINPEGLTYSTVQKNPDNLSESIRFDQKKKFTVMDVVKKTKHD